VAVKLKQIKKSIANDFIQKDVDNQRRLKKYVLLYGLTVVFTLLFFSVLVQADKSTTTTTITAIVPTAPADKADISKIYEKVQSSDIKINFFGTEYNPDEPATVWLQLLKNYQPINTASCYLTGYYPDKTVFLSDVLLAYLSGSDGVYYYDLTTPSVIGVYMATVKCEIPANAFSDDFSNYNNLEAYANATVSNGKVVLTTAPNIFLYPVGWWHLNETSGTNAFDSSGYGHSGTSVNNPLWVAGKLNNSLQFDGSTQYVDLGNNFGFEYNNSFSVEAWVNAMSIVTTREIISKVNLNSETGWDLWFYNQRIYMSLRHNNANTMAVHTNDIIPSNVWQHIVMTYSGSGKASGIKIYVNGTDMFLVNDKDTLSNTTILNDRRCLVGVGDGTTTKYYYFSGKIDEVVIYNYTLTSIEVAYRYNNFAGTESMGFGAENATVGYVRSVPITLGGTNWLNYSSIYDLKNGNINFKILDSSNNVLCSSLGDISSCANTNSPVKLYAQLTRPTNTSSSPEIDSWLATWYQTTSEEIRGSGEMHITNVNQQLSAEIVSVNNTVLMTNSSIISYIGSQFTGMQNWLTAQFSDVVSNIWNYAFRNVTATNTVNITNETLNITNVTVVSQIVTVTETSVIVQSPVLNITNTTVVVNNVTVNISNVTSQNVTVTAISSDVLDQISSNIMAYLFALRCRLWGFGC
jgi:hypothetical protein